MVLLTIDPLGYHEDGLPVKVASVLLARGESYVVSAAFVAGMLSRGT
jgi:hypothetical protein